MPRELLARIWLFIIDRRREIVGFAICFLISTASFAAGYVSAGRREAAQIIIERCSRVLSG